MIFNNISYWGRDKYELILLDKFKDIFVTPSILYVIYPFFYPFPTTFPHHCSIRFYRFEYEPCATHVVVNHERPADQGITYHLELLD